MMSGGSIMPASMNQNAHPRSRPEDAANYVTVRYYEYLRLPWLPACLIRVLIRHKTMGASTGAKGSTCFNLLLGKYLRLVSH